MVQPMGHIDPYTKEKQRKEKKRKEKKRKEKKRKEKKNTFHVTSRRSLHDTWASD